MKKDYATYYDYFIAFYKVKIVWYSIFGTMALLATKALLSFNLTVLLIIQVPAIMVLGWTLFGFTRLIKLDFEKFCALFGGEFIYDKINADYQNPVKNLAEGFVGKTYFIKKNPQVKRYYHPSDFCIKHEDVSWVYYQTIKHHVFGIPVRKTKALQVFAYYGKASIILRKKDQFDFADFLEEKGISFILGYSKEREAYYEAMSSKSLFIHTVIHAEQTILARDSAGPVYNEPALEVAVFNHRTLGEHFQAARDQLRAQLFGEKRMIGTSARKQHFEFEDTEQLALDLDTAAYKIIDDVPSSVLSNRDGQRSGEEQEMKKQNETTNGGSI